MNSSSVSGSVEKVITGQNIVKQHKAKVKTKTRINKEEEKTRTSFCLPNLVN